MLLWALPCVFLLFLLVRACLYRLRLHNLQQKAVLVTGCDTGFGFELVLRCLGHGMHVFAACLTEEGVQNLSATASQQNLPGRLDAFQMDVRSDKSVTKAADFVESVLGPQRKGLHAVVNNAGIVGNVAWDDWLLPEDYEQVWQVNAMGTIRVSQAFKRLVKLERGRFVTMSSTCGRVALPALGPYTVSKFAVEAYCDTIRTELILFGVKVSIVEPGFFRTSLTNVVQNIAMLERVWERTPAKTKDDYGQGLYQYSRERLLRLMDPAKLNPKIELVVDAYWHAISSVWPRRRYHVGNDFKFLFLPFSFLPTELQDLCFHLVHLVECPPRMSVPGDTEKTNGNVVH